MARTGTDLLGFSANPGFANSDGFTPAFYWDSGVPAVARSGDTLQTLAALYRVPVWSLAQTNQVPDDALLVAGERVIIPRHLEQPIAPSTAAVSGKTPSRR